MADDSQGAVEGHAWRAEQAITPLLASLSPSASNAFNANPYSALTPATLITFAHFSPASEMIVPAAQSLRPS